MVEEINETEEGQNLSQEIQNKMSQETKNLHEAIFGRSNRSIKPRGHNLYEKYRFNLKRDGFESLILYKKGADPNYYGRPVLSEESIREIVRELETEGPELISADMDKLKNLLFLDLPN